MCIFDYRKKVLAVSNRRLCSIPFEEQIERVCLWKPGGLILREKDLAEEEYLFLAKEILGICKKQDVPCIFHTYVSAARKLECSSVHLPLPLLRRYAGTLDDFGVIGTSVHSPEEAREACRLGATYLTAGHIYATDCKKGLPPRGTEFLREVCSCAELPVYAIGGIKPEESMIQEVLDCGAAGGCIMSEMMRPEILLPPGGLQRHADDRCPKS